MTVSKVTIRYGHFLFHTYARVCLKNKYCTKIEFPKVLLELFLWEFCKITSKVFAYVGT